MQEISTKNDANDTKLEPKIYTKYHDP